METSIAVPQASLTTEQQEELSHHESIIEKGIKTFREVGESLAASRNQRLYLGTHSTFELYCRDRWNFSRQRAHQLIDAAGVVEALSTTVDTLPTNEAQARVLKNWCETPKERARVWAAATKAAKGKAPSAKLLETIARNYRSDTIARKAARNVRRRTAKELSERTDTLTLWFDFVPDSVAKCLRDFYGDEKAATIANMLLG